MRFLAVSALLVFANACTIHVVEAPAVPVAVQSAPVLAVTGPRPAEPWPAPRAPRPSALPALARATPLATRPPHPSLESTAPVRSRPPADLTTRPELLAAAAPAQPQKPFPRRFQDTKPEVRNPRAARIHAAPRDAARVSLRDVTPSRSASVAKTQ
jgi:hypothetical protein